MAALLLTAALHVFLFITIRADRTGGAIAEGPGIGAGGMQISLVSAAPGGAFSATTAQAQTDVAKDEGETQTAPADDQTAQQDNGDGGAESSAASLGHSVGDTGSGAIALQSGATGGGYDPGAFASLAPLSFTRAADPALWRQVQRCLSEPPKRSVSLNVVLDETGTFVDAYPDSSGALVVSEPSADELATTASTIDALRRCGPYHDVPKGLGQRLLLVVPAESAGHPQT